MNVEPIAGKVLLKKLSIEQTAGGVIMPDIAQEGANEAKVVSIGPPIITQSGTEILIQCNIDDKVLYPINRSEHTSRCSFSNTWT